jgi:hypothetical protein
MLSAQEFAEESHGGFSIQEYKEQRDDEERWPLCHERGQCLVTSSMMGGAAPVTRVPG